MISYVWFPEAIGAIENVAEHINEMQSITEQFLPIFQELASANGGLEVRIAKAHFKSLS